MKVYVPRPMPDKPQPWFALPRHALVTLQGRDALAFSQAQFMSDVGRLQPGQWQWSGWLTPKGRVIALFALLVRDPDTAWLVLHDADPQAFAAALKRFVFRSKLAIEVPEPCISGSGGTLEKPDGPAPNASSTVEVTHAGDVLFDFGAEGGSRTLRVSGDPGIDDAGSVAGWARFDLSHGLPRLAASQADAWTPQQLSLDRLRAYSVAKGCYPGQEIVARTHFLGKAKRGVVLLEGEARIEPGDEVRSGDRALGSVASAEGPMALAVLPLEREAGALRVDGKVVRERPLLGGLAR